MATEKQIRANRANAAKSTGPVTPEGKRISSKNAALRGLLSGTVVLKGESIRRFNDLAAALILEFNPRNSAEMSLVQTMTVARWRLLRLWGIQTAGFELEMARVHQTTAPPSAAGAVLAAVTFRTLAETSPVLALQHRFEAAYDRQYNRALAMLLKLRETPSPTAAFPDLELVTETWDNEISDEANSAPEVPAQPLITQ